MKKLLVILTLGFLAIMQTADALILRRGFVGGPIRRAAYWGGDYGYYGGPYGYGYGGYRGPEYYEHREMRDLAKKLSRLENQLADARQDLLAAQQNGDQMRAEQITIEVNSLTDQINFVKQLMMQQQPTNATAMSTQNLQGKI